MTYLGILLSFPITIIAIIVAAVALYLSNRKRKRQSEGLPGEYYHGHPQPPASNMPQDLTPQAYDQQWYVQQACAPQSSTQQFAQQAEQLPIVQAPSAQPPMAQAPNPRPSRSMEGLIGRNVIGIIAAALVFLGIIFLGFLIIPAISNGLKIALMFLLGAALTVSGAVLTMKSKSVFTEALLGSGCGSIFISIMITHAYFQAIGDIVAFGLILVWMAGSLALVKISDSLLMSIIAHAGMVFSLCFAYGSGITEDRVPLLLAYHALAVGLITVGNRLAYKKMYRLGLFASLFLSLVAIITMVAYYSGVLATSSALVATTAVAAIAVQAIGAGVLSGFIFASTVRVGDATTRVILHVLNKVLFSIALFFAAFVFPLLFNQEVHPFTGVEFFSTLHGSLSLAAGVSLVAVFIHMVASAVVGRRFDGADGLVAISIIGMAAYASTLLIGCFFLFSTFYADKLHVPGLFVIALALIACSHVARKPLYAQVAISAIVADTLFMLFGGYASLVDLGSPVLGFLYLACMMALVAFEWKRVEGAEKGVFPVSLRITLLLMYEFSAFSILASADVSFVAIMLSVIAICLLIVFMKADIGVNHNKPFWIFARIHEFAALCLSAGAIAAFRGQGSDLLPAILLALACMVLVGLSFHRIIQTNDENLHCITVLQGICFTLIVYASIIGIAKAGSVPYLFSLVSMVVAFICIFVGVIARTKPLRIYGLVLVILSVLKLVTIDVGGADTLMRVIAFIAGGITCFGISALYNYAVKRFDENADSHMV